MLCDDLDGWDGGEVKEGRGSRIRTADSLQCTAETTQRCKSATPQYLIQKFTLKKKVGEVTGTSLRKKEGVSSHSIPFIYEKI